MCRAAEVLRDQALVPLMAGTSRLLLLQHLTSQESSPTPRGGQVPPIPKVLHHTAACPCSMGNSPGPSASQCRSSTTGQGSDGHPPPHFYPPFTISSHLHRVFHRLTARFSESLKTLGPKPEPLACTSQ